VFSSETDQNVFLQHKCYVGGLVDQIQKGKTPLSYSTTTKSIPMQPPASTIVFILGGATYDEARELSLLSKVTLGTTSMVNSK
jgi:hypothetical protein